MCVCVCVSVCEVGPFEHSNRKADLLGLRYVLFCSYKSFEIFQKASVRIVYLKYSRKVPCFQKGSVLCSYINFLIINSFKRR